MSWFKDESRCYLGGRKHHYEPRYTEKRAGTGAMPSYIPAHYSAEAVAMVFESARSIGVTNIYVRDVCIWCGATIELPKQDQGTKP